MKLNFEKNLPHQTQAVESIIKVFEGVPKEKPQGVANNYKNPVLARDNTYINTQTQVISPYVRKKILVY